MNVATADWLPYTLPFRQPWQTSHGTANERHGRLLRLKTMEGLIGWGDAAPLPEFGITEETAISFAEETAHLDLLAQKAGLPLHAWLSGRPAIADIAVNTTLGKIPAAGSGAIESAVTAGFTVVKLKVGLQPIADEIAALRQLTRGFPPTLRLRLDANRAWCLADAQAFIKACTDLPIEGLEEPLAEPEPVTLGQLQSNAAFPLAVDESIQLLDAAFFRHPPVRRIVIKPARLGGLLAGIELALRAQASGIDIVVTSSLESACGTLACAQLAAAIAPHGTHGLATGPWFSKDTGGAPAIVGGRLQLPTESGLGFRRGESSPI